jgi:hypothetical protein
MAKCSAITKDGAACRSIPMPNRPFCYAHDPAYQEERRASCAKGGKRSGRGRSPTTSELARLQGRFENLAEAIENGELDRGNAAVMIQAYNGARACLSAIIKAREVEEIEVRLQQLERQYESRGGRYGAL